MTEISTAGPAIDADGAAALMEPLTDIIDAVYTLLTMMSAITARLAGLSIAM